MDRAAPAESRKDVPALNLFLNQIFAFDAKPGGSFSQTKRRHTQTHIRNERFSDVHTFRLVTSNVILCLERRDLFVNQSLMIIVPRDSQPEARTMGLWDRQTCLVWVDSKVWSGVCGRPKSSTTISIGQMHSIFFWASGKSVEYF